MKPHILIRECAVCGHPLVIYLGAHNKIPARLFYADTRRELGAEYWECVDCN